MPRQAFVVVHEDRADANALFFDRNDAEAYLHARPPPAEKWMIIVLTEGEVFGAEFF